MDPDSQELPPKPDRSPCTTSAMFSFIRSKIRHQFFIHVSSIGALCSCIARLVGLCIRVNSSSAAPIPAWYWGFLLPTISYIILLFLPVKYGGLLITRIPNNKAQGGLMHDILGVPVELIFAVYHLLVSMDTELSLFKDPLIVWVSFGFAANIGCLNRESDERHGSKRIPIYLSTIVMTLLRAMSLLRALSSVDFICTVVSLTILAVAIAHVTFWENRELLLSILPRAKRAFIIFIYRESIFIMASCGHCLWRKRGSEECVHNTHSSQTPIFFFYDRHIEPNDCVVGLSFAAYIFCLIRLDLKPLSVGYCWLKNNKALRLVFQAVWLQIDPAYAIMLGIYMELNACKDILVIWCFIAFASIIRCSIIGEDDPIQVLYILFSTIVDLMVATHRFVDVIFPFCILWVLKVLAMVISQLRREQEDEDHRINIYMELLLNQNRKGVKEMMKKEIMEMEYARTRRVLRLLPTDDVPKEVDDVIQYLANNLVNKGGSLEEIQVTIGSGCDRGDGSGLSSTNEPFYV